MADKKRMIYAEDILQELRDDPCINGRCFSRVKKHINDAPTVDAVEVVHGRWNMDKEMYAWNCSVCRSIPLNGRRYSYCHNCGAKMDGEMKEGD